MSKLLIISGTLCALLWGFITAMSYGIPALWCEAIDRLTFRLMSEEVLKMANGFYYDVNNKDMPTVIFLALFGVIFSLVFYVICRIENQSPGKHSLACIIFFSVLFRLILLPGVLIHENDIYRYIWDAKTSLQGINPYKYAPADLFMYEGGYSEDYYDSRHKVTIRGKHFTDQDDQNMETLLKARDENPILYKRIGHWEVPTIYPPVAQLLFLIPVLIGGDSLIGMKALFVLFDIAGLFLIIGLLKHFRLDPRMSIIYGWSPLVLFEIVGSGHYDSIPIFFTLLGLFFIFKKHPWSGTCVIALAALSKFFSVVFLPIVIRPFKWRYLFYFGSIAALLYAPYVFWNHARIQGVFQGLMTYNQQWSYNTSIFGVIYLVLEKVSSGLVETLMPAKITAGSLYLGVLACLTFTKAKSDLHGLHKCLWAIALLFIINPVADPWYFCWVIPFLCFFPYRSWYLLSGLLMLSYLNFQSGLWIVDQSFWKFPLIGWLIYLPFFLYLVFECFKQPGTVNRLLKSG